MRIDSSNVAMGSTHSYQQLRVETITVGQVFANQAVGKKEVTDGNANITESDQLELSDQGKQFLDQQRQASQGMGTLTVSNGTGSNMTGGINLDAVRERDLVLIEMMLKALGFGSGKDARSFKGVSIEQKQSTQISIGSFSVTGNSGNGVRIPGVWTREVKASVFQSETENTTFMTAGIARTADGREITFNIDVEMSRSFSQYASVEFQQAVKFTDPLVINLGPGVTTLRDQKFLFDLDGDGKKENISMLGEGSGFLALDRNNDGIINDGTELFGTKSGNGFEDLRAYDEDGNGWIDENDSVFQLLKIWTKDDQGKDLLVSIGKAGVGAIYLGSASTEFSLKSTQTNEQYGQIRRTGMYLTESGDARTIQHLDLAV